jgi:Uma2 family endonuclease
MSKSAQLLSPPPLPRPRNHLLTSEEFLDWLQPGVHADLIAGEIFMHSPVNLRHANLINFIDHLLRSYIEQEELGVLHREVVAVRLSLRETFMPDLAFFTKQQAARFAEAHVPVAPTFVLEALSPATAQNDKRRKFSAYEFHGVQEYWILDPQKLQHRFYRRAGDMFIEFGEGADRIDSASIPGFWVKRAWLNPDKAPTVSACLAEILRPHKARGRGKRTS